MLTLHENLDSFSIKIFNIKITVSFNKARLREESKTEGFHHLLKYATKSVKDDEYYYPFTKHPRFKF